MGTRDLHEMYARSPRAQFVTLLLRLIALMPVRVKSLDSLYACLKDSIMVKQQVTL